MGPNGAGKTTTLRMILGLLEPDSGFAEVNGATHRSRCECGESKPRDLSRQAMAFTHGLPSARCFSFFADLYAVPPSKLQKRGLGELADLLDVT
jgi:sodium transport system ATP-binding protein